MKEDFVMTKFLETVCNSVAVVLSTIFLPVRILLSIVDEIINFPITMFISKFEIGVKEYFSQVFDEVEIGIKIWWNCIIELCEKD